MPCCPIVHTSGTPPNRYAVPEHDEPDGGKRDENADVTLPTANAMSTSLMCPVLLSQFTKVTPSPTFAEIEVPVVSQKTVFWLSFPAFAVVVPIYRNVMPVYGVHASNAL